ncbi:multidrug effflux MFS transporter [Aureimonas fodinaquatilis]|uniref:Multidrug effflux MFS transporter n=1 Tax=Aureimonas fodinaquatilis TaxID=2565783 RepID=A0A5B0DUM8_9HYPH|nr:MFS transporter [Aureimonas fodinaquatilis]KAA0970166.1 multidrug effflux MFS transporter [Aureimonas fodinaquatilis]
MAIHPQSRSYLLLLGLTLGLPSLGTDMAMASFSATALAYCVTPAEVGYALSSFMVGFATSPLFYGPLSDRFGRKPVLLSGIFLLAAASYVSVFATSLPGLIGWRLVQGVGAGVCRPLVMAIIRDGFDGAEARSAQSYAQVVAMCGPLCGPILGALLLFYADWQIIYLALGTIAAAIGLCVWFGFAETTLPEHRVRVRAIEVWQHYRAVLGNATVRTNIMLAACAFGGQFVYVSASPLLLMTRLQLSAAAFGLAFATAATGMLLGSLLSGRLNSLRVNPRYIMLAGQCICLGASIALFVLLATSNLAVWSCISLGWCSTFAFGLVSSNAAQLALAPMRSAIGYVAGLMAFVQIGTGVAASTLVFALYNIGPAWAFLLMAGFAIAGIALLLRPTAA